MEQNKEYTLARLILRLANRIVKNRDRHVKELGLTTEQADSLLFFLDRKDAVINDLKDHLGVTHQTARGIVQRMESKGLVQTRKSKEDGRYQVVSPTQAGWRTGSILLRNGHPDWQLPAPWPDDRAGGAALPDAASGHEELGDGGISASSEK